MKQVCLVSVAAALVLAACGSVSQHPISASNAARLKGQRLVVSVPNKPELDAAASGTANTGVSATLLRYSKGAELIDAYRLTGPGELSAAGLAHSLENKYGVHMVPALWRIDGQIQQEMVAHKPDAPYLLNVSALNWQINPMHQQSWDVAMSITVWATLYDTRTNEVLADKSCAEGDASGARYDDLMANGAKRFKDMTERLANLCVAKLTAQMFPD